MLFETPEQFEKKLKVVADRIDSTGELTELVIDYLIGEDIYDEILINKFLIFLRTKGNRIPYVSSLENPRYGNLPVDLVGENAYKYYFGAPACGNSSFVQCAKELLNEVSYYLAILTSVLLAEEKGVVKEGMHERFMTINTLFYTEDDEGNDEGAGERAGEGASIQFGYSATRLDDPCVSPYFLKEATKLFKAFETISSHGTYLVHGDFKIDNVLVDKRGKLCLIDFGLATIRIQFEDGTVLCGRQRKSATGLMFIDPLLFAITYCNRTDTPPSPENDYFDILEYYKDQRKFIKHMYDIADNFFYNYHREIPFVLDTHFPEYLKLKKN